MRAKEPDSEDLALWVEVAGVSGNAFTYDMAFLRREEIDPDRPGQPSRTG